MRPLGWPVGSGSCPVYRAPPVARPLTEADAHAEAWGADCLGYEAAKRAGLDPLDAKARRAARRAAKRT